MKKSTLAVHAGRRPGSNLGGVNTPVVTSSATTYLDDVVRYPRYFNQLNHEVVAEKIATLEGGEAALVTSSGMAAISAILTGLLNPGDHVVLLDSLYGGTHALVERELSRLGIAFSYVPPALDRIESALRPDTRMIYVESPTNPLLNIVDLEGLAALAREHGCLTAIDNTFASPVLQNPLALGIDVVMHSGTKFLNGHSDLICGALAGSGELIGRLREHHKLHGGNLNAQDLALLERSLKTLDLRVRAQSRNAGVIARALCEMDTVSAVHYPGLEDHPGHAVAARQMEDFGAMLSFRVAAGRDPVAVMRRLRLAVPAVSLGGLETMVCQPVKTSHEKMDPAARDAAGITPELLRLSVGIEDPEDVIDDLRQALAAG